MYFLFHLRKFLKLLEFKCTDLKLPAKTLVLMAQAEEVAVLRHQCLMVNSHLLW